METSNNGAGSALTVKLRTLLSRMGHFWPFGARNAEGSHRPTLENVKTIISVSLDVIRTALAWAVAVKGWGLAPA